MSIPALFVIIHIINDEIITAINCDRCVINTRIFTEIRRDVLAFTLRMTKCLPFSTSPTVGNQIGNIGLQGFYCTVFRITVVIGTYPPARCRSPVDFALGTINAFGDMIGNQDVAVVVATFTFNSVPANTLKRLCVIARRPFGYEIHGGGNGVVGVVTVMSSIMITHTCGFLTTDENLRDGAKSRSSSRL